MRYHTSPHSIPDFTAFEPFASRFYSDPSIYPACQSLYQHHIRTVLTRRNTFNGNLYKEDPVIFAWELANEPQIVLGDNGRKIVRTWIEESARVIKDLDANHLVTTGAEGKNGKDWKCTSTAILVLNNMLRHMGREYEKKLYS